MKNILVFWLGLFLAAAAAPPAYAQTAPSGPAAALSAFDTDKDGTLSWDEVRVAALAKFAAADTDHDGTLDAKEVAALGFTKSMLKKADPDKDGTLSQDEYLAIVKQRFDSADRDHDGTLSAKELASHRGKLLLRLIP
jgi:Ca2+-binding EF-hand superfamily protein